MSRRRIASFVFSAGGTLGLCLMLFSPATLAQSGVVKVKAGTIAIGLKAYGRVVPIALARLRAAEPGLITGVDAVPGQAVEAGAVLGHLTGPEVAVRLASLRSALASAQAALQAAEQSLTSERQKQATHLATRPAVIRAEAAVEEDKARLAAATTALQSARSETVLRAPTGGAVVALSVGDGERVGAGQTVLTVEPEHHLWVKAVYYGSSAAAVRLGMRGYFTPADGSAPFVVSVASIFPVIRPDGGLPVGLRPFGNSRHLTDGEAGTVTLSGTSQSGIIVPTRALILDRGIWWVLLHTPGGDVHQMVTLGPSLGDQTLIERGLKPGAEVVVTNAYLEFHRDVSQRYQPPD